MKQHIILFVFFLFFGVHVAYADDLELNAYARDINSPADANAVRMYDAWAENLGYRIEHGLSDGIVVDEEKETDDYVSDGVGNVIVKDGANVGPIINQTDLSNTTVIIRNNRRSRF